MLAVEKISSMRYLVVILLAISFVLLFSNLFGKHSATISSDWLNFGVSLFALVFSLAISVKTGKTGNHGKAWILLALCLAFWFVGERIWMVSELVYGEKPWPSPADYFWLVGYFFFFAFSYYYVKPFRKSISKKMIVLATVVPIVVMGATIYVTADSNSDLDMYEKILANSYPVLDSVSLVPVILGLAIFFRGAVHFTWILLFLGMFCFVVSDLGYLYFSLDDSYYTGHPIDIPYLWAYTLFAYGIMGYLRVFSNKDKSREIKY
ncbi:conserved membrane hypothetical protein [Nitrosotalea sinensis]|uniref:Histidine kinase N-terminal 7TM region domain-containing protein n=1 Tax=Nitrosotalea sinensis TaxID=1499975 RepID=A0A2H1EHA5_9ARCH|nr:hypothetical protein [Candidatus Nitrosotalea sinensis]SHO45922.1 conserved membrane hypothetical protein [Candidatus Nitrosotalea sinensis]